MELNIVLETHLKTIEQGKTLGRWPEETREERGHKQLKNKDFWVWELT